MGKFKTEIKWGVIFSVVMILWMVFERMMGWHDQHIDQHMVLTNLFAIPAIAVYVFALLDKRKSDYRGRMTWKEGFISGLYITLVVALLSPLVQILIHTVISPDYFQNVIDYSVNSGEQTREAAEDYFNLQSYMVQGLIGAIIMGVFTSAIVAAFTKKS